VNVPDVLVVGRLSVDLYPDVVGRPLVDASNFRSAVGGTSANVAVAASKLGLRASLVSKVGDDPLGRYARASLERHGVDASGVTTHPTLATPVVFIELDPPTEPSIWFYRQPSAPDEFLTIDDLDLHLVRSVAVLWVPGGAMAFEPSASTITGMLRERGRRTHTVLDIDHRPMFWPSDAAAGAAVRPLLDHVTVAVGNRDECAVTVGTADPERAARRMLDHGVELAIVKMGPDGVLAVAADGTSVVVPPTPVEVVCGLGAGDAFGGSLIDGLVRGATSGPALADVLRRANAAGAIVASRLLCSDDMPTSAEIDEMLATGTPPTRTEGARR
jgi:5-dehydro-2-deoxygluconokinase